MNPLLVAALICFGIGLVFLLGEQFSPAAPAAGQTWLYTNPNPFVFPRVERRHVLRVSGEWVEYEVEGQRASWTVEGFTRNSQKLDTP